MARIRTIKPEFWTSSQVMATSRNARLLFIGLWNFVDDAGRCPDDSKTIRAQVFPGDEDIDSTSVRRWLDELSTNDLLQKYEVNGRAYLQVTGWHHQKIDRPRPSNHPAPDSTNVRRSFATDLTLSNPNGAYPTGAAGSLATAPPSGALARQPKSERGTFDELAQIVKQKGWA